MVIQSCTLDLRENKYEKSNRGTPMFPCGAYITHIGPEFLKEIPWHWHNEVELLIVTKGTFIFESLNKKIVVDTGDVLFINTNILHSGRIIESSKICEIHSFVFDPILVSGSLGTSIENNYVRPILETTELDLYHIGKNTSNSNIFDIVNETFAAYKEEHFGYELIVRENITKVWMTILCNNINLIKSQRSSKNLEKNRVQSMMKFIHDNYMNSINLEMISNFVSVSTRESIRCFKKIAGVTPMQYLLNYRISIAANLLTNSEYSITRICDLCGFDSPSYFSYKFKKKTEFTPTEYRKRGIM